MDKPIEDFLTSSSKTLNWDSYDSESSSDDEPQKKKKKSYPQTFRVEWFEDPELKDWLGMDTLTKRATCRMCDCTLICHKKGLTSHAQTVKHKRAAVQFVKSEFPKKSDTKGSFIKVYNSSKNTSNETPKKDAVTKYEVVPRLYNSSHLKSRETTKLEAVTAATEVETTSPKNTVPKDLKGGLGSSEKMVLKELKSGLENNSAVLETIFNMVRDVQMSNIKLHRRLESLETRADEIVDKVTALEHSNSQFVDQVSRLIGVHIDTTGNSSQQKHSNVSNTRLANDAVLSDVNVSTGPSQGNNQVQVAEPSNATEASSQSPAISGLLQLSTPSTHIAPNDMRVAYRVELESEINSPENLSWNQR